MRGPQQVHPPAARVVGRVIASAQRTDPAPRPIGGARANCERGATVAPSVVRGLGAEPRATFAGPPATFGGAAATFGDRRRPSSRTWPQNVAAATPQPRPRPRWRHIRWVGSSRGPVDRARTPAPGRGRRACRRPRATGRRTPTGNENEMHSETRSRPSDHCRFTAAGRFPGAGSHTGTGHTDPKREAPVTATSTDRRRRAWPPAAAAGARARRDTAACATALSTSATSVGRRTNGRISELAGVGPPAPAGRGPRSERAGAAGPPRRGGAAEGPTTHLSCTHRLTVPVRRTPPRRWARR